MKEKYPVLISKYLNKIFVVDSDLLAVSNLKVEYNYC
jgi:hypothetical protein